MNSYCSYWKQLFLYIIDYGYFWIKKYKEYKDPVCTSILNTYEVKPQIMSVLSASIFPTFTSF